MTTFIAIIFLVFGILQIILFFKLWGMTNDIKAIKEKYLTANPNSYILKQRGEFCNGEIVKEIKTGRSMLIKEVKNGKYVCFTTNGTTCIGHFDASELSY